MEGVPDKIFSGCSYEEDGKVITPKILLSTIVNNFIKWIADLFREAKKVPALKIRDDVRENYNRAYNELKELYSKLETEVESEDKIRLV